MQRVHVLRGCTIQSTFESLLKTLRRVRMLSVYEIREVGTYINQPWCRSC